MLKNIHRDRKLAILHHLPGELPPFGDYEDMLELLGNLLDNACKWAESTVKCSITADDEGISIVVEDDGPGLSDREADSLPRRGTRLDETRDGHGLGLAICKEIVKLYGGTLSFGRSAELGGLRVTAQLRQPL